MKPVKAIVAPTWAAAQHVSRHQSVATVNANGAIRAVGTRSTYVVGTLSDRPRGARLDVCRRVAQELQAFWYRPLKPAAQCAPAPPLIA